MLTLIYHNGEFDGADAVMAFWRGDVGRRTRMEMDWVMAYVGLAGQLVDAVCDLSWQGGAAD